MTTPRRLRKGRAAIKPSLVDFITDPALLGPYFEGPSWDTWKAVLRAAMALPMSARDLELFAAVSGGRPPPRRPVREIVIAVGRGGGKDSVATAVVAHIAATGDFSHLRPGEKATVLLLASDRDQAGIAFSYTKGYFDSVPMLTPLVERVTADTIDLTNGAQIIIGTNNTRAPRGLTIAGTVYDEAAHWLDVSSVHPDVEVDAAVSPGLMRFPGSIKLMISSVNKRNGLFYDKHVQAFGKDDPDTLAILGTSLDFNPTLDADTILRDLERDPEKFGAEYLSQWRDDLAAFLDRGLVDAAVDRGVVVRPPRRGIGYVAFCDPSSGRGDAFTCAICHSEANLVILDLLFERRAPFDPLVVIAELAAVLRNYEISEVVGDQYAAGLIVSAFAKHGIAYRASERDRSELYLGVLPIFTSGRARLLDNPRLSHQLISLERRTTRTGRDIVGHPDHRNAHDDCANAVAGALVLAATDAAPSLIRASDLGDGEDFNPRAVGGVFAVISLDDFGQAGIVYFAVPRHGSQRPLLIIDMSLMALTPALFADVARRIDELAEQIRDGAGGHRPVHAGLWVPKAFQPRAFEAMQQVFARHDDRLELRNVVCAALEESISPILLADPVKVHFAAAAHATAGKVRFGLDGVQRSRELPVMGALTGRLGDRAGDNPLAMAVWLGVVLQFEHGPASPDPFWRGARMAA